jgi:hypothetical protein
METYKRINEDFLDKLETEEDQVAASEIIYEEIESWITNGVAPSFNPQVLPDAYYQPNSDEEFKTLVYRAIDTYGNSVDLNWIDTSKVEDMSDLFGQPTQRVISGNRLKTIGNDYHEFNGDISRWNVSSVKNMSKMFYYSEFTGNISEWDVSSVENMSFMFSRAKFNGNISDWNVSSLRKADYMFFLCSAFRGNLSKWRVDDAINIKNMMNDSNVYTSDYPKHKSYDAKHNPGLFSRFFK